jgi:hypothetical protein
MDQFLGSRPDGLPLEASAMFWHSSLRFTVLAALAALGVSVALDAQ